MHEGDRDRSLTNCRCNTLNIAGADVADGKNSRQARFKEMRKSGQRPMRRSKIVVREVRPRLDKTARIERQTAIEPPVPRPWR